LSLPEQVLPIVDLMAISSSHFAKLRDFITLQIPSGFPVKIEIPLFHVLNARITFGNIFSLEERVQGVTLIDDDATKACVVDERLFDTPTTYSIRGTEDTAHRQWTNVGRDDDELVQLAIQQCLLEDGSQADQVTLWEALRSQEGNPDADLQRAIQESLADYQSTYPELFRPDLPTASATEHRTNPDDPDQQSSQSLSSLEPSSVSTVSNGHIPRTVTGQINPGVNPPNEFADDLTLALRLSQQEAEANERRQREEDEMMRQIIELSMTEK
jgi:septin 4